MVWQGQADRNHRARARKDPYQRSERRHKVPVATCQREEVAGRQERLSAQSGYRGALGSEGRYEGDREHCRAQCGHRIRQQ